jgi:Protein of unknown function (DUF2934)
VWLIHQFGSLLNLGVCKEYSIMPRAKSPRNGRKAAEMSVVTPISAESAAPASNGHSNAFDLQDEIRRRAYELYEERGCEPGHEVEDWFEAERQVMGRLQQIA